jgi:GAF domain-containing protein
VPDADPDAAPDVEGTFSQVAMELFDAGSVAATLQRIVDLAQDAVVRCDGAGIVVVTDGQPSSRAAGGPLAEHLDRLQVETGEGPGVDAALSGATFAAADLEDDPRWPTFAPRAVAAGVRSVLALALATKHLSALNLYARSPGAFGSADRAQGVLFATFARLALAWAEERAAEEDKLENLTEALRSRELIGQAQGILMERQRLSADQAFDVLRRASQRRNIKLRDVALRLVETGESPDADADGG